MPPYSMGGGSMNSAPHFTAPAPPPLALSPHAQQQQHAQQQFLQSGMMNQQKVGAAKYVVIKYYYTITGFVLRMEYLERYGIQLSVFQGHE